MTTTFTIDKWGSDILDSRDILERIADLQANEDPLDEEEAEELAFLLEVSADGEYSSDWRYGVALIHSSYFTRYAQELAEDIGAIDRNADWPLSFIDWEAAADALKGDYFEITAYGHTYYAR